MLRYVGTINGKYDLRESRGNTKTQGLPQFKIQIRAST